MAGSSLYLADSNILLRLTKRFIRNIRCCVAQSMPQTKGHDSLLYIAKHGRVLECFDALYGPK
jgi:hypothetical protein